MGTKYETELHILWDAQADEYYDIISWSLVYEYILAVTIDI